VAPPECSLPRVGFSISWLAVRGKEAEIVLGDLGLTPTGERDELAAESPIAGASLEGGWYVIVLDGYEHELVADEVLKRISEGCEVVAAGAEEHVGACFAVGWRDAERIWWISHNAEEGLYNLEAGGTLPEGFESLRRDRMDEQDAAGGSNGDVDHVFDIPLESARRVCGFVHDGDEPAGGFAVLARIAG
jgi:hypothetical protein